MNLKTAVIAGIIAAQEYGVTDQTIVLILAPQTSYTISRPKPTDPYKLQGWQEKAVEIETEEVIPDHWKTLDDDADDFWLGYAPKADVLVLTTAYLDTA